MSHELPWGTAWVAEADLATYVKELEKRPQRQQALITRMLAEAGDGKDRSLARLLLLQDKKVGTQRHRHTGEKRAVPLKDSARERYKRASEIRSGRSWDPDQQYFYLPVSAVSAPKGLLRTPDPRPSKGGPASGQRAAFDLLVGSAVDTAEPTDSQMVVVPLEELVVGAFRHAASLSVADVHTSRPLTTGGARHAVAMGSPPQLRHLLRPPCVIQEGYFRPTGGGGFGLASEGTWRLSPSFPLPICLFLSLASLAWRCVCAATPGCARLLTQRSVCVPVVCAGLAEGGRGYGRC
jgi:hypothetical protein